MTPPTSVGATAPFSSPSLKAKRSLGKKGASRRFVAIDFETADYGPDSACAVSCVRVEGGVVQKQIHSLIRPPRSRFVFSELHGITWSDVAGQPSFPEYWPVLKEICDGVDFIAAHNARFDQGVMRACCAAGGLLPPDSPFLCTVKLARQSWGIYPTKLPDVCRHFCIPLKHHDAASDAWACAQIVLLAGDDPLPVGAFL